MHDHSLKLATEQSSQPEPTAPMHAESQRLGAWYLILAMFVAFLVVVGGTVRLTDSGLSIPEWPLINGSLLPPLSKEGWQTVYQTYYQRIHDVDVQALSAEEKAHLMPLSRFCTIFAIEYFHRFVAAVVGLIFLVLFGQVLKQQALRQRYSRRLSIMLVLLLAQAILGGIVVKFDLEMELVTVHLGMAFLFFALVLWTALDLLAAKVVQSPSAEGSWPMKRPLVSWSWAALVAVYLQVLLGGLVASSKAGYVYNTWPKMGEHWLAPLYLHTAGNWWHSLALIQFVHRWWAFVAMFVVFILVAYSFKYMISRRARFGMRAVIAVVVLQVLLGIATLVMHVPLSLGIAHLAVGLLLFAILVVVTHELQCHEVKTR